MKISVVIPTFKASPYIRETLESIFSQTLLPDEIVVVDDCSPDDTLAVVERIAATALVPIRIVRLSKNTGSPSRPMNVGVEASQGDCVALLDQDDLMVADRLEWHAKALSCPEIDFTFGWIRRMDGDGTLHDGPFKVPPERLLALAAGEVVPGIWKLDGQRLYEDGLVNGSLVGASNIAFRKSLWSKVGGFPEDYRICWDYEFFCRATRAGGVGFCNACVALYRLHSANFHRAGDLCSREWLALLDRHYESPLWPIDRKRLKQVRAENRLENAYRLAVEGRLVASLGHYVRACSAGAGIGRCAWRGMKAIAHTARSRFRTGSLEPTNDPAIGNMVTATTGNTATTAANG